MKTMLTVLLSVLVSLVVSWFLWGRAEKQIVKPTETAFERIMRTRVIRCGYYVYPPVTYKDGNTGALSGLSVDMMEQIAARADLKVEWVQEVNFGDWTEGLKAKRFDVACTPMWPATAHGQVVYFSKPFFYSGIYAVGRQQEERFQTLQDLNQKDVTLTAQEGNDNYHLAKKAFPHTKMITIAPNADGNLAAQDIVTHKADFMLSDKNFVTRFNEIHPNSLKILVPQTVKTMPFSLAVSVHEDALLHFLNNALDEMIVTGDINRLVQQWVPDPSIYLPVASPVRE